MAMNLRGRIERLERRSADGCPHCPLVGFRFDTPPEPGEIDALPDGVGRPVDRCPVCGEPIGKVIILPNLACWMAL